MSQFKPVFKSGMKIRNWEIISLVIKIKQIKGSGRSWGAETSITWSSYSSLYFLWGRWLRKLFMGQFQRALDKLMMRIVPPVSVFKVTEKRILSPKVKTFLGGRTIWRATCGEETPAGQEENMMHTQETKQRRWSKRESSGSKKGASWDFQIRICSFSRSGATQQLSILDKFTDVSKKYCCMQKHFCSLEVTGSLCWTSTVLTSTLSLTCHSHCSGSDETVLQSESLQQEDDDSHKFLTNFR